MDWQLVLDFVKALIWPVVTIAVVAWLKDPIRERFGAVEKVSAMGVEVEMAARAVEQEAKELSESLTTAGLPSAGGGSEGAEVGGDSARAEPAPPETVDPGQPVLSEGQKRAIGELVQQAAEWGSLRAGAGLSVQGAKLHWEGGIPRLATPSTTSARVVSKVRHLKPSANSPTEDDAALDELVRRLESRVSDLDRERRQLRHTIAVPPGAVRAAEEQYRDAVDRLRALDPRSPYVD